jgi:hypothetical protein
MANSFGKVKSIPASVGDDIGRHLAAIQSHFTNSKVTFLARAVGFDDGSRDMVMTDDDLSAAIKALEIRRAVDA